MQRSISKTFDELFKSICTSVDVTVMYDPEFDVVTKVVSIMILKSAYNYQENTRTFTGAELLGDITPIVFNYFPAMLAEIKLMDCWKEAYKKTCELKGAAVAEVNDVMTPYDSHTLAMNQQ